MKKYANYFMTNGLKKSLCLCLICVLLIGFVCLIYSTNASVAEAQSSDNITYFGTVVPCGKDNGYKPNTSSSWNPWTLLTIPGTVMGLIPNDDPHKGWSLGSFYLQGYSDRVESSLNNYSKNMPVYLKNVGDELSFGFKLDQSINELNGNSQLSIADDKKVVQDCWIEEPYFKADFHHGLLMIVHTDWQGNQNIIKYTDFLKGKSVGANTQVRLFEEGDYRVILCYEIYKNTGWNWITNWMDPNGSWFDYRMESYFSIRNGNCMVYPMELGTNTELYNRNVTEQGFKCDLAKSRYLHLTVKKENLNEEGTDIIEDVRFNKAVADGTVFQDEGKYTITVQNPYTLAVTEKIIYVGTNDVMKCNAVTGKSVSEINHLVSTGYKINSNGTLSSPSNNDQESSGMISSSADNSQNIDQNGAHDNTVDNINAPWKTIAIVLIVFVIAVGVITIVIKAIRDN